MGHGALSGSIFTCVFLAGRGGLSAAVERTMEHGARSQGRIYRGAAGAIAPPTLSEPVEPPLSPPYKFEPFSIGKEGLDVFSTARTEVEDECWR